MPAKIEDNNWNNDLVAALPDVNYSEDSKFQEAVTRLRSYRVQLAKEFHKLDQVYENVIITVANAEYMKTVENDAVLFHSDENCWCLRNVRSNNLVHLESTKDSKSFYPCQFCTDVDRTLDPLYEQLRTIDLKRECQGAKYGYISTGRYSRRYHPNKYCITLSMSNVIRRKIEDIRDRLPCFACLQGH